MNFYQPVQDHFQRDAVKRIVGSPLRHVSSRSIDFFPCERNTTSRSYVALFPFHSCVSLPA
jgi:hypothetical protein